MKKLLLIICALHLLSFSIVSSGKDKPSVETIIDEEVSARTLDNSKLANKSSVEITEVGPKVDALTDKNYYKLLYENSVESNNRIISTMQWALGLVATFMLILLGSQVFFNYRISKEETASIRSDLEEQVATLKLDLVNKLNTTINENERTIASTLQESEDKLTISIQNKLEQNEKLFNAINENINKDLELLSKNMEIKTKHISIELNQLEGQIWRLRGVNANALKGFIRTANMQLENRFNTKYTLIDIVETLNKMDSININDYDSLTSLLAKLTDDENDVKNEIEKLYIDLPKYKFVDDPNNPGEFLTKPA